MKGKDLPWRGAGTPQAQEAPHKSATRTDLISVPEAVTCIFLLAPDVKVTDSREHFLITKRGEAELIGLGARSVVFPAWARSSSFVGQSFRPLPMMLFMALLMTLS